MILEKKHEKYPSLYAWYAKSEHIFVCHISSSDITIQTFTIGAEKWIPKIAPVL